MRVLVTGGAGFIGLHLARAHADAGDIVLIVDNLAKAGGEADPDLSALLGRPGVELHRSDLSAAVPAASLFTGIDVVYHLAAINGTELFYEIPYELARANLKMTLNLLDALAEARPRRLVYASSSEVYADAAGVGALRIPTDESVPVVFMQPTNPRFSYGTSKFMGEFLCLRFGERMSVPTTVVRYHNVFGPRMGSRHVIPQLIARVLQGEDPLRVFGRDETRAFCFVSDAVEATRRVASARVAGLVHVGDPRHEIRIDALAERIMRVIGVQRAIVGGGRRPGSVARRAPNIGRLRELTGFEPAVDLDEGLRRTVEWYEEASRQRTPR